jgi:hypothetical protein
MEGIVEPLGLEMVQFWGARAEEPVHRVSTDPGLVSTNLLVPAIKTESPKRDKPT